MLFHSKELPVPDLLPDLLDDRAHLLSQPGDFQPGSITNVTRRCGKLNCHCAQPRDPGHGPHRQLTQKIAGKTVTQTLSSPEAVRKAEREIAEFRRFQKLSHELLEINQRICSWLRRSSLRRKKTAEILQQEIAREVEHLLQLIFSERRKTGGLDLEAIEMAIRSAMHQAGATTLSELLKFDPPGVVQCRSARSTANRTAQTA